MVQIASMPVRYYQVAPGRNLFGVTVNVGSDSPIVDCLVFHNGQPLVIAWSVDKRRDYSAAEIASMGHPWAYFTTFVFSVLPSPVAVAAGDTVSAEVSSAGGDDVLKTVTMAQITPTRLAGK